MATLIKTLLSVYILNCKKQYEKNTIELIINRFDFVAAPITIQANPNPWPIVEPVFHFGPGFEHQHYCPTHSQGPQPHEYIVFFHVNAGVSVTFQIGGNREVIRGKNGFSLFLFTNHDIHFEIS